jgi:hypothetical protein
MTYRTAGNALWDLVQAIGDEDPALKAKATAALHAAKRVLNPVKYARNLDDVLGVIQCLFADAGITYYSKYLPNEGVAMLALVDDGELRIGWKGQEPLQRPRGLDWCAQVLARGFVPYDRRDATGGTQEMLVVSLPERKVPRELPEDFEPTPPNNPSLASAVERACKEPTLTKALSWIAVWETERAIKQAKRGEVTNPDTGAMWDTCFEYLFNEVQRAYRKP